MRIAERVPRNINVNEFKNFKEKIARANKKKAFKKISARPSINRPKNVEFLLNLATPPSEKSNTRYTKYKIIPKSKNFSEPVIINKPIQDNVDNELGMFTSRTDRNLDILIDVWKSNIFPKKNEHLIDFLYY